MRSGTSFFNGPLFRKTVLRFWPLWFSYAFVLALALPVLCYGLGTMLLLCGVDARFFQCSMAVCIPCMLAMLYLPMIEEA